MSGGGRRLTVLGWQILVLCAMGVVVLVGAAAGALLMNRTDHSSRELIDDIQPARVSAYELQAALRDQETAVRGYVIAADPQFLDPYYAGQRVEKEAAEDIRQRVGTRPDLVADLNAIERAAAAWRTAYAESLITGVNSGAPNGVTRETAERAKTEFDRIRQLFDRQNEHLAATRTDEINQLDQIRGWRDAVLAALVAAFFMTAIVLAVLVRRAVTRPLAALAASCRRITEGHFAERITPRGPKDIRAIAVDVEDMRQRIVDELDASRAAREALDEQADELRRSNAELEQFAYVASHDLQEPLRKVASFCQLLEKRYSDQLDERGAEYIGFAVDGAKRMQALINDLLTFSRVGRVSATHTEVDLNAALDTALGNLSTAIDESGAEIVRPAQPLPTVDGDPTLMSMVWQNLIGNAMKFQKEGTVPRVVIECEDRSGSPDREWLFSVSDNGIGIAAEFAEKVFIIFQRLQVRDVYSGTGIGLALCKKIVEHHGGSIWVDTSHTSRQQGARILFTLPDTPTTEPNEIPTVLLEGTHQ